MVRERGAQHSLWSIVEDAKNHCPIMYEVASP